MKKIILIICVMVLMFGNIWSSPIRVNAAVTTSNTVCTVTKGTASGLTVIPGMEGITISDYAHNGDYILAFGTDPVSYVSYLFVLDNGKFIKKYSMEQVLAKTTLKNAECITYRIQYINKHFYILISGISDAVGKSTYNAYCQALVTDDGLSFTKQSLPTYKIPSSKEYYPCGVIYKMGSNYIYTPNELVLADASGKLIYYTSENCKTWTKHTTISFKVPKGDEYAGNEIIWSIAAATSNELYFYAEYAGWMGYSEHTSVEAYVSTDFKTYTKVTGLKGKKDSTYDFYELPTYSKDAVLAVERPLVTWEGLDPAEDTCTFYFTTKTGKFTNIAKMQVTSGNFGWLYNGGKTMCILADLNGVGYLYQSVDKGKNFTKYRIDELSTYSFYIGRLLISTDKTAYIAYGDNGIISSEDGFLTMKLTTIDGEILDSMVTDSANYIVTNVGVCRLTDAEMDKLFK